MPVVNKIMLGKLLRRAKLIIDTKLDKAYVNDVLWRFLEWTLCREDLTEAQKVHFAIVMRDLAKISESNYASKIGL